MLTPPISDTGPHCMGSFAFAGKPIASATRVMAAAKEKRAV